MRALWLLTIAMPPGLWGQPISQPEMFRDISGKPFFPTTYQNVNGTPYLFEDWTLSRIHLKGGKVVENVKTNIHLLSNELHYLDENGKVMVANTAFLDRLENQATRQLFILSPARSVFLEVLADGRAQLLKRHEKVIIDTKAFNSATIQRNFVKKESLLLSLSDQLTEIRRTKDLLEALVPNDSLRDYAKHERLTGNSDATMVKLVKYFNSNPD